MKDNKTNWQPFTYVCAFVIGVILFWAFGRSLLNLGSRPIFLAGLIGVGLSVLLFGVCNILRQSNHRKK
jgi:peptidoglycan/LPS O-acetylase OafA/YrhL